MALIVPSRAEIRFRRRWDDYCQVLEHGTPTEIGKSDPKPPDAREVISSTLESDRRDVGRADASLDAVWKDDERSWPRRLSPFLRGISTRARNAFTHLVKAGCQPDMLAYQFHEATRSADYAKQHDHVRGELAELTKLASKAIEAIRALAYRRQQLDEYLLNRRLRVLEGEPGDAELKMLLVDFETIVAGHSVDDQHMQRHLDGRREPFLGHAEVRLSRRVHEATGSYHDTRVECVLNELRERVRLEPRAQGSLKRRRARWMKRLSASSK